MSSQELIVLRLLIDAHPDGLFSVDILHKSKGIIRRGSHYTLLNRMFEKGQVSRRMEGAATRVRYWITPLGRDHYRQFLEDHRLLMAPMGAMP